MSDLQLQTAMLCIKDYKTAFDGLRELYENQIKSQNDSKCKKSTEHVDLENDADLLQLASFCATEDCKQHDCASSGRCVNDLKLKVMEKALSKLRSEYEILNEQMLSDRTKASAEITDLKHSLDVAKFEKMHLRALGDARETKRRSRPQTPQPQVDELVKVRAELEASYQKIKELGSIVASLEMSREISREKYHRLKSKYSMMTQKIRNGLLDQLVQPTQSTQSRTMSLLQL